MNKVLLLAGYLNALVATLHLGCIVYGAPWYRFFGAGEQMAIWAVQGNIKATLYTLFIATVLFTWSAYAFSGAGTISRLPWLKVILVTITSVYILRGVAGFFLINNPLGRTAEFWLWSSIICLGFGIVHLVGLKQVWSNI